VIILPSLTSPVSYTSYHSGIIFFLQEIAIMKPKPQPSSESKASSGNVSNVGAVAKYFKRDVKPTFFVEAQLVILTFCTGMQGESTLCASQSGGSWLAESDAEK
jgi:hypothetical protein